MSEPSLTLLYDGACPLCLREVTFLKRRDLQGRLAFVDIDRHAYDPAQWGGISYRDAMARIHAIRADGEILKDVAVFREAYRCVGLGWIYAPTEWPLIGRLIDRIYALWASQRLRMTGRASLDQLCNCKQIAP
jgi:predicted DCC family thiol-disulfide oxidoreductase YuxK